MPTEFETWLLTRPPIIQELGRECPPDTEYIMSDDAPYAITCPGTVVSIFSYCEDGTIKVVVDNKDLRPEAIEHIKGILHPQGRSYEEVKGVSPSAYVDPQYLIPHKRETT